MNNIILIMGASSDIGIELIKSIDEDCLIIAHYNKNYEVLQDLSDKITCSLIPLQADLSDERSLNKMLDLIEEKYGVPNKIVHLPATKMAFIPFKKIIWNDFEQDFQISLKSLVIIANRFLPKLAKKKCGKMVVMLSSCVLGVPPKALAHYTTVKYALLGLVKSLAKEYADKSININGVSPSMVETQFLSDVNEKIVELSAHNHPLKRNAQVTDIIPIIKFLLSEESNYMNGVNIPVTGGSVF